MLGSKRVSTDITLLVQEKLRYLVTSLRYENAFERRIRTRHYHMWGANLLEATAVSGVLLDRHAPLSEWCSYLLWQRLLSNKWNSREFASKHGVNVPELYWHGRNINNLPFETLPPTTSSARRPGIADGPPLSWAEATPIMPAATSTGSGKTLTPTPTICNASMNPPLS